MKGGDALKTKISLGFLLSLLGLAIIIFLIPSLREKINHQNLHSLLEPPSLQHWFGTDSLGRDLFIRVVAGSLVSLSIAFGSVFISLTGGLILGLLTPIFSQKIDALTMGICQIFLSIPSLLLSVLILFLFSNGFWSFIFAMGIAYVPFFTKIIRSFVLNILNQPYIFYPISLGASKFYIIKKHLLKQVVVFALIQASYTLQGIILGSTSLGFIGLGIAPPLPEWGKMIFDAQSYLGVSNFLIIFPITVMFISMNCIYFLANAVQKSKR